MEDVRKAAASRRIPRKSTLLSGEYRSKGTKRGQWDFARRNWEYIGFVASGGMDIPPSEPVAAVGQPPAKDADGNGGQQRPHDRQGEVRYQPKRNESGPEDLAFHSSILARPNAKSPVVTELSSRRNTCPGQHRTGFRMPAICDGNAEQRDVPCCGYLTDS